MIVFVPESGQCRDKRLRRYVAVDGRRNCRCGCRACLKALGWSLAWKQELIPGFYGMPPISIFLPDYLYKGPPAEGEEEAARRHTWVGSDARVKPPANVST